MKKVFIFLLLSLLVFSCNKQSINDQKVIKEDTKQIKTVSPSKEMEIIVSWETDKCNEILDIENNEN